MRKTILILLTLLVLACAAWYAAGLRETKAEELIWAAYQGDMTGVKNALDDGAETDWWLPITDPERHYDQALFSTLMAAASSGNDKLIRYLLEHGHLANQQNDQNWTPLFIAVRDGRAEAAALLIRAGADINAQTDRGTTPLIMALLADFLTKEERFSLLNYMLKRGARPNLLTELHTDALFYAVTELQDEKIVQLLLEYQADVCRSYDGKTMLDLAPAPLHKILKPAYKKQCH